MRRNGGCKTVFNGIYLNLINTYRNFPSWMLEIITFVKIHGYWLIPKSQHMHYYLYQVMVISFQIIFSSLIIGLLHSLLGNIFLKRFIGIYDTLCSILWTKIRMILAAGNSMANMLAFSAKGGRVTVNIQFQEKRWISLFQLGFDHEIHH